MQRHIQERLTAEIDHYLATGTTAMADSVRQNPVIEYVAADHLAREKAELFRRYPVVIGHGAQCAEPKDFFTDDVAGVPILVVRQADRSLKAFLNVCRHRGTKVTFEDCGHRAAFTCPYHAWTYRLDGTLANVTDSADFGDIDRSTMGLVELAVEERHGLIWVMLAPDEAIDVEAHLGGLDEELASYQLDSFVVERSTVLKANLNWKVIVDGFLETYHLRHLHATTIGPYIRTNLTPFEPFGQHSRSVAVRASYPTDRDPDGFELLAEVAVIYQVFPNTILVWQADHFESWMCFPEGDNPGRSVANVQLLAPNPTETPAEQKHWDRNWKVLMASVLNEDFLVGEAIQQGFGSGAQTSVTFGRNEPTLQHFHQALAAALAEAD